MTGATLVPGFRIGDYELIHRLGRGAVGETFAARVVAGSRRGELICLKVLAQEFRGRRSAERDAAVRYLQHEARVVSQLEHPNIARLLDSGTAGDDWYLAFELVDGANLAEVLAHGALGAHHVMHLGLELSKALACAHERDVLHRDIKPSNILISVEGEVKLVDFGLAKLNVGAASQFSQHVGTPRYFSPEQLRGEALTPATDIFAVGLVLFELLTGSHPFYSADIDLFRSNVLQGLPQQSLRGKGIPTDLVAIVERCILLEGAKRFADGAALHNALREAIDHCSRAGDADLRDLSVLRTDADDFHDSQAETRLGHLADRVVDVRDEPGDVPTRITADPAEPYRRAVREIGLADTAPHSAATTSFGTESIMSDLSRIARAVAEQCSSGLAAALPHRSGLRTVDDATPLLRQSRACTAAENHDPLETTNPSAGDGAQHRSNPPGKANRAGRRRTQHSTVAAISLVLTGFGVVFALMRPTPQSQVPPAPAASTTVVSAVRESSEARTMNEDKKPRLEAAETQTTASAPPSSVPNAAAPSNAAPNPKHAKPSRAANGELIAVTIGTIPYADVIVDGRRVGLAPVVVALTPGRHRVVARAQQLHRAETVVVNPEMNRIVLDLRNDHALP